MNISSCICQLQNRTSCSYFLVFHLHFLAMNYFFLFLNFFLKSMTLFLCVTCCPKFPRSELEGGWLVGGGWVTQWTLGLASTFNL